MIDTAATPPPPYIEYVQMVEQKAEWAVTILMCRDGKIGDVRLTNKEINSEFHTLVRDAAMSGIDVWSMNQTISSALKHQITRVDVIGFSDQTKDYWVRRLSVCWKAQ